MKDKVEINREKFLYILYSILDFGLTFGGTSAVIIANYVDENNSTGYKITFSGIILVSLLFFTAKAMYEHSYQRKLDNYLQDLASATDNNVKTEINKKINVLKRKQDVYNRVLVVAPFALVYLITYLGAKTLESLNATCGLMLASLGIGSIFNILKKPKYEQYKRDKLEYKVNKKYATTTK
jgi:hypothetical protein